MIKVSEDDSDPFHMATGKMRNAKVTTIMKRLTDRDKKIRLMKFGLLITAFSFSLFACTKDDAGSDSLSGTVLNSISCSNGGDGSAILIAVQNEQKDTIATTTLPQAFNTPGQSQDSAHIGTVVLQRWCC